MGDLAVNIARGALELIDEPAALAGRHPAYGRLVQSMVRTALDSAIAKMREAGRRVLASDDER
jgi:phosphate uptake regulator